MFKVCHQPDPYARQPARSQQPAGSRKVAGWKNPTPTTPLEQFPYIVSDRIPVISTVAEGSPAAAVQLAVFELELPGYYFWKLL
ncbi:hypothetical protein BH23CHL4_BH23CHL4_21370 [soil metagenome]